MTKAEQYANKRWPIHPATILPKEGEHGEILNFDEWLEDHRIAVQSFSAHYGFIEGYNQAEKDLALTISKLRLIDDICDDVYEEYKKSLKSIFSDEYYQEVLKRYNESKLINES